MFMKKLIISLLFPLAALSVQAQEARTLFVNMPDSLCPLLSTVNRADCIDFLDSKMRAVVTNTLGGKSEMTTLTPDYIRVQLTRKSTWQMKVLPLPGDTARVICAVSTVSAPAADSRIHFYTTDWRELPAEAYLSSGPAMNDFLPAVPDSLDTPRLRNALRQADMLFLRADLQADSTSLVWTFETPRYMSQEAADELKPVMRRSLVYKWENGQFRP